MNTEASKMRDINKHLIHKASKRKEKNRLSRSQNLYITLIYVSSPQQAANEKKMQAFINQKIKNKRKRI